MVVQFMERPGMRDSSASTANPGECFCPECGQSLQLTRHPGDVTRRRTPEPWLLAIVGLYLAVLFGARTWQVHGVLVSFDRQIEDGRTAMMHDVFGSPSNRAMVQAENVVPLLTDRVALQRGFERNVTGLVLGLVAIVTAVGTPIRTALGLAARRWQGHAEIDGPSYSSLSLVSFLIRLWALGDTLARLLFRLLLIVFGGAVAAQMVRGVPLTLDVVDQALTRTVDVVTAIGGMLE